MVQASVTTEDQNPLSPLKRVGPVTPLLLATKRAMQAFVVAWAEAVGSRIRWKSKGVLQHSLEKNRIVSGDVILVVIHFVSPYDRRADRRAEPGRDVYVASPNLPGDRLLGIVVFR